ncbi:MAG: polysaccharide biosynthesis protein [Puniceicoccales bacterium]|jgi:FlaA1/EpsC-like NDP-sugar epimerase|nr:polysaccharide biosynthesis protein [Puniceicoccales bacterium]
MIKLLRKYFGHTSILRTGGLLCAYATLLAFALFVAYVVRVESWGWVRLQRSFLFTAVWLVPLQISALVFCKHFNGVLAYFRIPDLIHLFQALLGATAIIILISILGSTVTRSVLPYGVVFDDFVLSVLIIGGARTMFRVIRERNVGQTEPGMRKLVHVAIIGAGDTGAALAADWLARPGLRRQPVVFLDDDTSKHGLCIHEIPVVGPVSALREAKDKYDLHEVVLAVGNAPAPRMKEIFDAVRSTGLSAEIVPSLTELASGHIKTNRIRPVQIQDLLGRDTVPLDNQGIREMICGKTVLVTGAGGSIGSELCRQIAAHAPGRLLLVERCEVQIFKIEQNLIDLGYGANIQPLVGDITDEARMRHIFQLHKPDIIFHAAAHKHVFMMERQPWEAVRNNTLGTRLLIDLAIEHEVERFIFISTDKAINPTNVMGATKRMAEMYLQSRQHAGTDADGTGKTRRPAKTRLMAVRFGNVLGSSGSVIPIFNKQIANGGPVKVTHPDVTRYFMTIPEAVGLVLQCAILGQGGEIFVLNMGKPIRIAELARQMIELSGYRPDIDIQIEFIGLRPGEKLFEELQHVNETHQATEHSEIMRFVIEPRPLAHIEKMFQSFEDNLYARTTNEVKKLINAFVPEYKPHLNE